MSSQSALIDEFRDEKYRREYVESFFDSSIAAQIRALRRARNLSQARLANLIGTQQSGVSKMEDVNYSRWSVKTLRRLAKALDVVLIQKFVSFGEALAEIESFSESALSKPTFDQDPTFLKVETQAISAMTAPLAPEIPAHVRGVPSRRSHTGANHIETERTEAELLISSQTW